MQVGEEKTSIHLPESTTSTVSNETLLENNSINNNELAKEASESNTREEKGEESAYTVPKLDDAKPSVAVAVGEAAENNEVIDEIPTADVECGGSELTNSVKVDGEECEADVIMRDNGLNAVEENVRNSEEDSNTNGSLVIENVKDGGESEMEIVKLKEDVEVPKDGEVPIDGEIGERKEVMTDVKNDDGVDSRKENVEILQGDEAITEGKHDVQGGDAQLVNEERIIEDEAEALVVGEGVKEEGKMDDVEKTMDVTEHDDEEPMVEDEDKSLDTDLETDEEATMADEEKVPDSKAKGKELHIKRSGRKRKRGRKSSKATPKSNGAGGKMIDEDVCFICFDGGKLVLCDKRDCPKAYHPSCVNRDEAFFQTKGKWNCGWHLCSICEKKAEYMCYTCTFSLCKTCIKTNVLFCVREEEKKGLCEACMKTVMLIEKNSQENQENVDFDDKSSWEYLFKDYWTDMKAKLNLSLAELVEAKNAWKGSKPASKKKSPAGNQEPPAVHDDVKDNGGSGSENPSENQETKNRKRRKSKKVKPATKEDDSSAIPKNTEWASKELLEFVMHMGNDKKSYQSQFDVQALLLEYIKTNKLRDSRRKSQIICDARLQRLFGKPRVGHFEMLKLLESHFLIKEDSQMDNIQGSVVDTEDSPVDDDVANETVTTKVGKDRKRKIRKKGEREPQSNRDDYAAIDNHNISLIYLRRKLVEDLLNDKETFHSKVVGTFVRIRISGANPKHDIYRLVQVTGTSKGEQHAVGKKMIDTMLEILNLDKTEYISIDTISNQDFTEDECKRLRQSIKCGLINRLTVGDILDKAIELQAARVNDWLETEVVRLNHLRDRASDLGRKKELRECVEKLQVLKTPEERARRLQDIPVIHDDSTMDPDYVSQDDTDEDDKKQDMYKSSMGSRFTKRRDYPSKESWRDTGTGTFRSPGKKYEFNRSLSNTFSNEVEDAATTTSARFEPHNETTVQQPSALKKPSSANNDVEDISESDLKVNETEKMWHYKDPSGKIQGPFSMAQLRKWNNKEFFPVDLRIWRKSDKEDDAILLTDALEGRFTVPSQSLVHVGPLLGPSGNKGLQSPTPNSSQLVVAPNMAPQTVAVGPYGWSGGPLPSTPSSNQWVQPPPPPPPPVAPQLTGHSWVPPQLAQGPIVVSGNVNPNNWVGPPGEVASGGNANQGWRPPTGPWDGREQHQPYKRSGFSGEKRNRDSGFHGNTRHWDKPGTFNNRGRY